MAGIDLTACGQPAIAYLASMFLNLLALTVLNVAFLRAAGFDNSRYDNVGCHGE